MEKVRSFFTDILKKDPLLAGLGNDELYKISLIYIGAAYTGLCGLVLFVCHMVIHNYLMALISIACPLLCAIAVYIARNQEFDFAAMALTMIFTVFTTASIIILKEDNYYFVFYFTIFAFQAVFPFEKKKNTVISGAVIAGLLIFSYIYHCCITRGIEPGSIVGRSAPAWLKLVIICLAFIFFSLIIWAKNRVDTLMAVGRQEEESKEHCADDYIDPVTQLYSMEFAKKYFDELEQTEGTDACIAVADFDDFKKINDLYGSELGDKIVRRVADILVNNTRKSDLIFRWKDEGFLLLLSARPSDTYRLLDKIRELVSEEVFITANKNTVSVSITIGMVKLDMDNIQKSLDLCSQKVYIGKKTGKNIVVM